MNAYEVLVKRTLFLDEKINHEQPQLTRGVERRGVQRGDLTDYHPFDVAKIDLEDQFALNEGIKQVHAW